MHGKRVAVALIALPALYLYVMRLHHGFFFVLLLAVSSAAIYEFFAMYRVPAATAAAGILGGAFILSAMQFNRHLFPDALVFSLLLISTLRLLSRQDPAGSLRDLAPVLVALLYIPCSLGFQLFLRDRGGPGWVLFLYGCVWAADSLAYYVGKSVGKRKLYASVSPNKTVAGAVGSVVGGGVAGWLLSLALVPMMGVWRPVLVGAVIGTVTIAGDLVESMFKRDAGVKDSGSIIPGHGGILDKIDGALFAGPVTYWVARLMGVIA